MRPLSRNKKIVCLGFMGACPIAGVVWQQLHYLVGLKRLGYDVTYVEDCATYPYNPQSGERGDWSFAARMLSDLGARFGFDWAYCARFDDHLPTEGMSLASLRELYAGADAILNICGSHALHDDLVKSSRLIYVESDPGVEQIRVDAGTNGTYEFLRAHQHLFTFGERVPAPEFPVPKHGLEWQATRQPVVTDLWPPAAQPPRPCFTSIANWSTDGQKDETWRGQTYRWSKTPAFLDFQDAPLAAGEVFELATDIPDPELKAALEAKRWCFVPPDSVSDSLEHYQAYIAGSKGEFTVAKDQYVRLDTGWFSDRSACYLASGRPVITQHTGFDRMLPTGRGLFSFRTLDDIRAAADAINADYALHCRAAREIAVEYFDAGKVLASLLARAGV